MTAANDLNFSAGPGALPAEVLDAVRDAVVALPETGLSVLCTSHRSAWFEDLLAEAEANLRHLLAVPASHGIVFLQGGSSLQFSMIPANFAPPSCDDPLYVRSGHWSAKAIAEAGCVRPVAVLWDGAATGFRTLPTAAALTARQAERPRRSAAPAYLHYVSNEKVEGLQFAEAPGLSDLPRVADMSSDFLSRPADVAAHAFLYAHAQKNLGPAGVTVCVLDRQLLERVPAGLPPMLDYRTHLQHGSNYNTPPVFGIYVLTLVTRWLRDTIGGVAAMQRINQDKAARLYRTLEGLDGLVQMHAAPGFRSLMNVPFRFRDPRLDALFLEQATAAGFSGLAGHRALGGLRASLYNAVTPAAVARLCNFVADFAAAHG